MTDFLKDKRARYLALGLLAILIALGALSLAATVFQLIVPLAIAAGIGFAVYKIAIEGRDLPAEPPEAAVADSDHDDMNEAAERLSAVQRAHGDFLEAATPAEEILDQIKARRQRLSREDE